MRYSFTSVILTCCILLLICSPQISFADELPASNSSLSSEVTNQDQETKLSADNNSTATITNAVVITTNTGNNVASNNDGDSTIKTGDSASSASLYTEINSSNSLTSANTTDITQTTVINSVAVLANTGSNEASHNMGNTTIQSGSITATQRLNTNSLPHLTRPVTLQDGLVHVEAEIHQRKTGIVGMDKPVDPKQQKLKSQNKASVHHPTALTSPAFPTTPTPQVSAYENSAQKGRITVLGVSTPSLLKNLDEIFLLIGSLMVLLFTMILRQRFARASDLVAPK